LKLFDLFKIIMAQQVTITLLRVCCIISLVYCSNNLFAQSVPGDPMAVDLYKAYKLYKKGDVASNHVSLNYDTNANFQDFQRGNIGLCNCVLSSPVDIDFSDVSF